MHGDAPMSNYTKTGDEGTTGRPGGRRVPKTDPLVEANGTLDELNAHVGFCRQGAASGHLAELADALAAVQADLLTAGAVIAAVGADRPAAVSLGAEAVERLEGRIDAIAAQLPELTGFVLPGGTELACRLHLARTVCRRAERALVGARAAAGGVPASVAAYVNRLSDLLFMLARQVNHLAGREDETWRR